MKKGIVGILALGTVAFLAAPAGILAEERTVVGRIEKLDRAGGAFSVVDGLGTGWNFKVGGDAGIDLEKFHVGDRVSVTIRRATPPNMMSSADVLQKGDKVVPAGGY